MPPIDSAQKRSIRNSVSFLFNSVGLRIAKWISVLKGVHLHHTVIVITTFNTNATLKFVLCTQQATCMLKIRELASIHEKQFIYKKNKSTCMIVFVPCRDLLKLLLLFDCRCLISGLEKTVGRWMLIWMGNGMLDLKCDENPLFRSVCRVLLASFLKLPILYCTGDCWPLIHFYANWKLFNRFSSCMEYRTRTIHLVWKRTVGSLHQLW